MAPDEEKTLGEELGRYVASGYWWEVTRIYRECPESHVVKVTKSGDTVLHVAVSNELEDVVRRMLSDALSNGRAIGNHLAVSDEREDSVIEMADVAGSNALAMGNYRGNTPLHLAALVGNTFICHLIAEIDYTLIGALNDDKETPLFAAVSRGRTETFLYLHNCCKKNGREDFASRRKKNGDTILHSAISELHFDLAYIIIREYPKLVHQVNEKGLSPLHLLASKPSAFPSGTHLIGIRKLVYHCICVQKLAQKSNLTEALDPRLGHRLKAKSERWHRRRTGTLTTFRHLLCLPCSVIPMLDFKDDKTQMATLCLVWPVAILCMMIYAMYKSSLKLVKFILGYEQYVRLKHKKERCIWSVEVMEKILKCKSEHANEQQERHHQPLVEEYCYVDNISPIDTTTEQGLHVESSVAECRNVDNISPIDTTTKQGMHPEPSVEECRNVDNISPIDTTTKQGLHPEPSVEESRNADNVSRIDTTTKMETALLIAAKHGVVEMVEGILNAYPGSIFDVNAEKKNIVMLPVEHRQPHLYDFLLDNRRVVKNIFEQVDKDGNSVLHIAAKLGDGQRPWRIRGAALQMHMEVKWYKFVKKSMPPHFFARYNCHKQTPKEIFLESHRHLKEEGRKWLTDTSQSCSLVAALIATVAFATSATVPGGLKQDNGAPTLEHKPIFIISASSSLVGLSFSMISVVMFLGILTSSFKLKCFRKDLPNKLLLGLISLLISIVSMLVSFFAGHHYVLREEFKQRATLVYALLCSPLVAFIIAKFPLDYEIVRTTLSKWPRK